MAISKATIVQRVRDVLGDNPWSVNFTQSITATQATIPVPDGTRWDEGAIFEFQDTGEQCWVASISGNTLTVYRGYNGTTKVAHDGSATPINCYRDPTFTFKTMVDSLQLIMQSNFPYDYKKVEQSLSYSTTKDWYDLNDEAMGLISVSQISSSTRPVLCVYGSRGSNHPVSFSRNLPSVVAPSGVGIRFPRGWFSMSMPIVVEYAAKISTDLAPGTTNYADVDEGVQSEMLVMGAAMRMVMMSTIPRATQEDINMGDSSVTPTARAQIASIFNAEFLRLRSVRWEELRRTMPLMGTGPSHGTLNSSAGNWNII